VNKQHDFLVLVPGLYKGHLHAMIERCHIGHGQAKKLRGIHPIQQRHPMQLQLANQQTTKTLTPAP
jgi:hypothetical protein